MSDESTMEERIQLVESRLADACSAAGRDRDAVQLVAVSKHHPPESVMEAARCGLSIFGENKVQEARHKVPACDGPISWHLIGHLQSNKTKFVPQLFDVVHSVDSEKILRGLNDASVEAGKTLDIFLQVNISREASKFGLEVDAVEPVLDVARSCINLNVVGLMTMPPITADPAESQPHFANLRELRDQLRGATDFPLDELSMGMSRDFPWAIKEGATYVRIGTDIFGKRNYSKKVGQE
jgi:pyridoxal phosphate enzyme (YggS family)